MSAQSQVQAANKRNSLGMRSLVAPPESPTTTVSADLDWASHAPINRLPPELLAEIFEVLLAHIIDDRVLYLNPLTRLEVTVAHVCRNWRYVACNTRTLWTYISHPVDSYLRRYLSLAGGCLLDLDLDSHRLVPLTILNELRSLAPRWRSLRFDADLQPLHEIEPIHTPSLEHLHIHWQYPDTLDGHDVLAFLTSAPRLRCLAIYAPFHSVPASRARLPSHSHITSLTLDLATIVSSSMILLLEHCRETLKEFILDIFYIETRPGPSRRPTSLPALERLRFRSHSCDILEYIDTPNIEEMALDCTPGQTFPGLLDFLLRCPTAATRIRRLEVNPDWVTMDSFLRFLSHLTHLEELRCRNMDAGVPLTVMNALIYRNNGLLLLPALTYIQLSDHMVTTRVYKKLLSSRAVRSAFCRYGSVGIARLLQCRGRLKGGVDWGIYALVLYDKSPVSVSL